MRSAALHAFVLVATMAVAQDGPPVKLPAVIHTSPGTPTKLVAGTYRIWAYATNSPSGEPTVQIVIVADSGAVVPPGPIIPPTPDTLTTDLQTLYAADQGTGKATHVSNLAKLYRRMPEQANDPAVKTTAKLFEILTTSRKGLMDDTAIVGIRNRLGTAFKEAGIPTNDVPLTDALRAKAAAEFGRIAAALEAIKP